MRNDELTRSSVAVLILSSAASFHLAYWSQWLAPLLILYFATMFALARIKSPRGAFYAGWILGVLIFAPKLGFFLNIFGAGAILLWLILAFFHGVFLFLAAWARGKFDAQTAAVAMPILWTGVEYFRSELYPLKFSWLAAGYAFAPEPGALAGAIGVYGIGLAIAAVASWILAARRKEIPAVFGVGLLALLQVPAPDASKGTPLRVAGAQMEFPAELEVEMRLEELAKSNLGADLFVLSEYTFDGPPPARVKAWCKRNAKHLVVGGKEPVGTNFYNTAFVIGPEGEIVFKQVKVVPIQFFADGLPAPEQKVWDSPWGKIGILICYDLSFTRVVDELARQGAEALIVPTMDVIEWGRRQHEMHAVIAPMRAAEYRVPIFRLASSGTSQVVSASGNVEATAPFPGEGVSLCGELRLGSPARLPLDRRLAPFCSVVAGLALVGALLRTKRL